MKTKLIPALLAGALLFGACSSDDDATTVDPDPVPAEETTVPDTVAPDPDPEPEVDPEPELTDEQQVAAAEITANVEAFFNADSPDERVANVARVADIAATLAAAAESPSAQGLTAQVTTVTFPSDEDCAAAGVDAGCAAVSGDLLVGGTPMLPLKGHAVIEDGRWKLSAQSFCTIAAFGGLTCEPLA